MYSSSRPEKVAHLVVSATDTEKFTRHGQVRDYSEVHDFIEEQQAHAEVQFTWHYLDPQLRRRLVLTCARDAIYLATNHLEIPRFTVESHEFYRESQPETMGTLILNASGMFESNSAYNHYIRVGMQNPDELHEHYQTLRQRSTNQITLNNAQGSGSFDAPISKFSSSTPAA